MTTIFSHSIAISQRGKCFAMQNIDHAKKRDQLSRLNVATNPQPLVVSKESLMKQDLVGYLSSGCKPKDQWRIGTEHEKFGFERESLNPMTYDQIAKLLNAIADNFGWERVMDDHNIVGLKQGKQNISLEAGGQLEHSGAPVETLHHVRAEIDSHLFQVKAMANEMGIGFFGMGFHPKCTNHDTPFIPKARYAPHRVSYPKLGSHGLDVIYRTSSIQVNLDFSSELDMIHKFRASLALQPLATALFANSPFTEGKPNGYLSFRSEIYTDIDSSRTGMLPFVFDDSFGFEKYVDYALDVPLFCLVRENKYIPSQSTFRDFMAGNVREMPGELPTINDWEHHLGLLFPEVRLRKYMEMRGADSGPLGMLYALPAFWVGLLYDDVSLQNVIDLISDWSEEERQMLRNEVPRTGLNTPFRHGLLKHVAQDVVKWAKDGLERRGLKEASYLNEVVDVAMTGVTKAEKLLEMYHGKWEQRIDPLFKEAIY